MLDADGAMLALQRALAEKEALFETQRDILETEMEQVRGRERQATIRLQQALAEVCASIRCSANSWCHGAARR